MKNPEALLAIAMGMSGASSSEISTTIEKMGQARFVSSTAQLPIKGCQYGDVPAWDILKEWGIVVTRPLDRWMYEVALPPGWSKVRTDHSMYNNLLDEKGAVRASIFYKSTPLGVEDAFVSLKHRFDSTYTKDDWDDRKSPCFPIITDSGKTVWRGAGIVDESSEDMTARFAKIKEVAAMKPSKNKKKDPLGGIADAYERQEQAERLLYPSPTDTARRLAREMLAKLFPNANDATKYWDLENIAWPPSESSEPTEPFYRLHVSIYRNGSLVDSGSDTTKRFTDDAAAIEGMTAKVKGFLGSYDKVDFNVTREADGVSVHRSTVALPRKEVCFDDFGQDIFGNPRFYGGRRSHY